MMTKKELKSIRSLLSSAENYCIHSEGGLKDSFNMDVYMSLLKLNSDILYKFNLNNTKGEVL